MAQQPESRLVNKILKFLKANYPGFWTKIHGGPFQKTGLPDIIGCYKGRFISFEVKMPGNVASERQKLIGSQISKRGKGIWAVVDELEQVQAIMLKLSKRYHSQ